jgi:hypothetical protein
MSQATASKLQFNGVDHRDPMSAGRRPHTVGASQIQWRNRMTKFELLSAALIATAMVAIPAVVATHAMARENKSAVRQYTTATTVDGALCTRAPAVGAFATQPWDSAPPYEPTTVC